MSRRYSCLALFSLNSRLFCLARVSRIFAMTCHVRFSLVSIFFYGLNLARVSPRIFVRENKLVVRLSLTRLSLFLLSYSKDFTQLGSK